jgi:CD109 antigen
LTAPAEILAGGRSAATLSTLDVESGAAIGRAAVLTLEAPGGGDPYTLFSGATGASGHVSVEFSVPPLAPGSYIIRARVAGIDEPLDVSTRLSSAPAILIETDKPIYKPSQTIRGRVVLLSNSLEPVAGTVEVTFHDAKGIRIDREELTADAFGAAPFTLDLASEVNFGTWKIRAQADGAESVRDVRVEEYTLPRYDLGLSFAKSWALVDEPVAGAVEARYFFGKDVAGSATVSAKRWVGVWEEYATAAGELAGGRFDFELPPVGFVSGTPGASGQGTVTIDVSVVDSTGHTQTTTDVLTITEAPVVLALISRTEVLKPGIPAGVVVTSEAPDGAPLSLAVETTVLYYSNFGSLLGEVRETVETTDGAGELELVPPDETGYAEVRASAELEGRRTSTQARIGGAFSPSGSFISLSRADGTGAAEVGEVLRFAVISTDPGTVYYEVYAGGRTVFSSYTEEDSFSVAVTPEMVPRAKVVAYKLNPDNEVAADATSFDVALSLSVSVAASFGAEEVKPGDPVVVTIDAGTGKRTLLGVSIVDNSVLALGRSRLHLAEVFGELERRFLEPQAEAHEGGHGEPEPGGFGGPGGFAGDFFAPPRTRGALDVLAEVGLRVAVSPNLTVPEGGVLDFWRDFDALEDVAAGPPAAGGAEPSGAEPPVRVRQFFPETWVWEPTLLTDEAGRATLSLTAPDSITSWRLTAVSTTPEPPAGASGIAFGEAELTVFQDFFVEPSLPYSVTRGEEFPVKVDVFNYLEEEQTVRIELGESTGFALVGASELTVAVPANSATAVHFPIALSGLGAFPLSLTATGSSHADAVLREIKVVPEGLPAEIVLNGVIEAGSSVPLDLSLPPDIVPGSARAFLNITPSPVSQTMQGVSDLLGMPYGCGEQNMIFLAPDIEILKYLREIGELSTEVRATAEYYVNVGYQRELTFQTEDGGFAAFGGAEGSLWLTAFVLSTFAGAREVRDIDEGVLARAAGMLVSRQNPDGSFRTDDFLIHQEMDGGLENLYAMTAYVTNALADYAGSEVAAPLALAAGYLESGRTALPGVNDDPYSLSIAAVALLKVPGRESAAEAIIDRLLELAIHEGVGIHWEPYPVETTGYAAMALLDAQGGAGRPEAAAAVDWLSTRRNALGGYGESTQDTVVAIRALFLAARKVHRDLDVSLAVRRGGEVIFEVHVDESNFDLLHQTPLPFEGGALELSSAGSGNVGYQVVKRFNVPGEVLPPARDLTFDVSYDASHIEVDDIVDVLVSLMYTGFKEETGMVIADVGVPTGFAVVQPSLDALLESETVSRVEVAGRKVIFYIDGLVRDRALAFTFQIRSLYPVRAEGPISRAYEYYDPDVEAFHRQGRIVVAPPETTEPSFIRGDSNADSRLDLSDGVSTLNVLFLGASPEAFCQDAADANDDGGLNITDPIHVLNHLFLSGRAPAAPYPGAGVDPTPDRLGCRA